MLVLPEYGNVGSQSSSVNFPHGWALIIFLEISKHDRRLAVPCCGLIAWQFFIHVSLIFCIKETRASIIFSICFDFFRTRPILLWLGRIWPYLDCFASASEKWNTFNRIIKMFKVSVFRSTLALYPLPAGVGYYISVVNISKRFNQVLPGRLYASLNRNSFFQKII